MRVDGRPRRVVAPPARRYLTDSVDGTWRSPVAHLNGVQGVAGSNPAVPTGIGSTSRALCSLAISLNGGIPWDTRPFRVSTGPMSPESREVAGILLVILPTE
jgi:hypothetical protein